MVFQTAVFRQEEAGTARGRPKQGAQKSRINTINTKTKEYRGVAQLVAARFGLGLQAPPVADSAQQGQAQRSLTSSDYFAKKEAGTARGRPKQSARKSRINTINTKTKEYRGVAQLVARLLWEQDVAGSNPVTSTRRKASTRKPRLRLLFS